LPDLRVAIDTGGTFTDCVYLDGGELRVLKLRSTPENPARASLDGLRQISPQAPLELRHGTTVGTNAMLERKGARVAFVTTAGFEDTIAIGRQTRPKLYDLFGPAPACLVPPGLRFGVEERVSAEGEILREPNSVELASLADRIAASGAQAIAISLLFSFLRPENELLVEAALRGLGLPLSTSNRILPEFREYERASTVVVNAYLMPKMQGYMLSLEQQVTTQHPGGSVQIMQSSGGILSARQAAAEPVRTLLSGPAGGVLGAARVAASAGFPRVIGLDMGGTSTDVFLLDAAQRGPQLTGESRIGDVPVSVPMLDIHTAGAGGGSIARFDAGGLLRVGPESAGSDPGPICFGAGEQPTVIDANLLLGRLDANHFVGGAVKLDADRARNRFRELKGGLASVEDFAFGILRVVESQMERAIRVVSVERGHDPRRFTLLAFGGGGPLHACALARSLRIPTVLIPAAPGALSAIGILFADEVRDLSRTVMLPGERLNSLEPHFRSLEESFNVDFPSAQNILLERSVDLRYQGQGYELNVPYNEQTAEAFHLQHEQRYGFADRVRPYEIVNVRLRLRVPTEEFEVARQERRPGDASQALCGHRQVYFDGIWQDARIYERPLLRPGDGFAGPALIAEYTSTTVVPPGCLLEVDGFNNLLIAIGGLDGEEDSA
jgi:N-methylhydantoinase A